MENIKKMNTTWICFGKVMENVYHLNCVLYKLVEVNTILICTMEHIFMEIKKILSLWKVLEILFLKNCGVINTIWKSRSKSRSSYIAFKIL